MKKAVARLTENDDVIKPMLRGVPCLSLALGPAPARASPGQRNKKCKPPLIISDMK